MNFILDRSRPRLTSIIVKVNLEIKEMHFEYFCHIKIIEYHHSSWSDWFIYLLHNLKTAMNQFG